MTSVEIVSLCVYTCESQKSWVQCCLYEKLLMLIVMILISIRKRAECWYQLSSDNPFSQNPTIHPSNMPEQNVHIFVLYGALWDTGQMHFWICEFGLLIKQSCQNLFHLCIQEWCHCHNNWKFSSCSLKSLIDIKVSESEYIYFHCEVWNA